MARDKRPFAIDPHAETFRINWGKQVQLPVDHKRGYLKEVGIDVQGVWLVLRNGATSRE
jgi:hypothetical protein